MSGNKIDGQFNLIGDTAEVRKVFEKDCDGTAHIKANVSLIGDFTNAGKMTFSDSDSVIYIDGLVLKKGASIDVDLSGPNSLVKIINITNENGGYKGLNFTARNGARIIKGDRSQELKDITERAAILQKKLEVAEMEDRLHQLALTGGKMLLLL